MYRCEIDRRIKCEHADKRGECDIPTSEGWTTNCKIDKQYVKQTNRKKEA